MKKKLAVLAVLALVTSLGFAQDAAAPAPSTTFNFSAQAVALPGNKQTVAGTVVGATFAVTQNFSLRSDNLMAPASGLMGYFGGLQYKLPILSSKLDSASPTLSGNSFEFYLTASAGVDHLSQAGGDVQHYAFLGGGGIKYDPTNSGHFSVNLIEVRYAKLPGYANNTAIVSSGMKIGF